MRGHLILSGSAIRKVQALVSRGLLIPTPGSSPEYAEAVERLAVTDPARFEESDLILPTPRTARQFLVALEQARTAVEAAEEAFLRALAALDRLVLQVYGVDDREMMELIGHGMPWASTMKRFADAIVRRL